MSNVLNKMKFHHIGMAVKDGLESSSVYAFLGGGEIVDSVFDPIQNVNISWLKSDKNPLIEFLEPVDDKSPINNILVKNGVTPYHICYQVENLEETINELRHNKFTLVSKPSVAPAIDNNRVAFLFHKSTGLIELVEMP